MSRRRFLNSDGEKILNKCPLCGSELEFINLCQYSNVYRILKNGKISKVLKYKRDEGSIERGFIACANDECNFHTDCKFDTDTTGQYQNIYIHQSNDNQFMINVDEGE